eukprot:2931367-Pleurochrysis_carterae.AAC.2
MYTLATDETKQDAERPRTIVYAPGLREMAMGLEERLGGCEALLCTSDEDESLSPSLNSGVCWDSFPSGDPNVKLRIDAIRDRDVIFIMSHRTEYLFEQLAVLQFLLRFNVRGPTRKPLLGRASCPLHPSYVQIALLNVCFSPDAFIHVQNIDRSLGRCKATPTASGSVLCRTASTTSAAYIA